jgi:hypothetical protein
MSEVASVTAPDDKGTEKTDDKAPKEKTAAQKAYEEWQAAKAEEESGPQKAQFMRWMDEWAEKRTKSAPKSKTPQGDNRPKSFMERLLGDVDSA